MVLRVNFLNSEIYLFSGNGEGGMDETVMVLRFVYTNISKTNGLLVIKFIESWTSYVPNNLGLLIVPMLHYGPLGIYKKTIIDVDFCSNWEQLETYSTKLGKTH